jgi:hypothetical protein
MTAGEGSHRAAGCLVGTESTCHRPRLQLKRHASVAGEVLEDGYANKNYSQLYPERINRTLPMTALIARLPTLWNNPSSLTLRRLLPVLGPGYVVAVGYIDPGNWATDVAAGARFGFAMLSVVLAPA